MVVRDRKTFTSINIVFVDFFYYDKKASYRLLCKSCNSHFGSYDNN